MLYQAYPPEETGPETTVPREAIEWVPKRVAVREAEERTLRVEVVSTLSPIMNLFVVETEEEEDGREELEGDGALEEDRGREEELDDWTEEEEEEGRVPTVVAERVR